MCALPVLRIGAHLRQRKAHDGPLSLHLRSSALSLDLGGLWR